MLCGRLEAEGVPAFVVHAFHVGNKWMISVALGGAKVQVPSEYAGDARRIEELCRRGEFRTLLEAEIGDLDDVRCPKCGAREHSKRRPLPRAALAIMVSLLCGVVCPPLGWVYFCDKCGWSFMAPPRPGALRKWLFVGTVIAAFLVAMLMLFSWIHTAFGCPDGAPCYALRAI